MDRRILISCAVLLVVFCIVLSIAVMVGAWFLVARPDKTALELNPPTQIAESLVETATPPAETGTDSTSPRDTETGSAIPTEILDQMELIQQQVIEERGLEPAGVFTRTLYTTDQLRQHVLDDFLQDYTPEEMAEDGIVLSAFGLLNADFDLYHFYVDLFSENIAGFYDNETKEMVVVQGSQFGGIERLTYAHEYTHALQDQNYDIREGLNYQEETCQEDSERCAALQALLEGDASLSELNWFINYASNQDRADVFSFSDTFESPTLDSAPAFIAKDFLFPYEDGYEFVQYLYDQGGWDAVDQAFMNPPVSTEQILHPTRYPADMPTPVTLPALESLLGAGWELVDQGVMGEWYTFLILAQGLDEDARRDEKEATKAAEGWGGDAYQVYYHAGQGDTIMVFRTLWESTRDAQEFADSFQSYAFERFGRPAEKGPDIYTWQYNQEYHRLDIQDQTTTWILGPDQAIVDMIINTLNTH